MNKHMMNQLPNIDDMKVEDAILFYLKETNKVYSTKNRIAGTYSDEYKAALYEWKLQLNKRCNVARKQF